MKILYLEGSQTYDGSQLRAHWILRQTGLAGDAMVAFRGRCAVAEAEMADLEDLLDGPGIAGDDMVHFVAEFFDDGDLLRAVFRQRLVSALALDTLRALSPRTDLTRDGDDLYAGEGKLSISIATRSLVSTLIHFAVNVVNTGTPVRTASLADLEVDPAEFAQRLLSAVATEHESILLARAKVRAKGESAEA